MVKCTCDINKGESQSADTRTCSEFAGICKDRVFLNTVPFKIYKLYSSKVQFRADFNIVVSNSVPAPPETVSFQPIGLIWSWIRRIFFIEMIDIGNLLQIVPVCVVWSDNMSCSKYPSVRIHNNKRSHGRGYVTAYRSCRRDHWTGTFHHLLASVCKHRIWMV